MKTTMTMPATERDWWHVDGTDQIVGRIASRIAMILMGKHKPTYTPHIDTGDFVVLTNAEKVVFTGKKLDQKVYRHHTEYIGGLVEIKARKLLDEHPERVIGMAVRRMMPKNKLGDKMFKKLKIYVGAEHPHGAQNPKDLDAAASRRR